MSKSPISVKLIEKRGDEYDIKFPNLKIPVTVNHTLYQKMLHSNAYEFYDQPVKVSTSNSA
ncbi:hypothetical protein BUL40_09800 [Croceivirga radicis]|uniref:Uncharacterized protein n=1 Tax=Croceivirga radicis TaxID=1929488 RepID=A0A1V6LRH5_9FLAO|nr:hypothetical protein [Croceivirga radicis]OQD42800.1 hypothetical protein BUL40_09800 [Croceivirga radicis]